MTHQKQQSPNDSEITYSSAQKKRKLSIKKFVFSKAVFQKRRKIHFKVKKEREKFVTSRLAIQEILKGTDDKTNEVRK